MRFVRRLGAVHALAARQLPNTDWLSKPTDVVSASSLQSQHRYLARTLTIADGTDASIDSESTYTNRLDATSARTQMRRPDFQFQSEKLSH
jgi:hypothetical protein